MTTCPHGKRRLPTEAAARDALLVCRIRAALRGNSRRRETRIYFHKDCGAWHLTSKADRSVTDAA